MKTPNMWLTELILDLTTHELRLKPILAHWHRIGGATPGARLESVWSKLKALREALDRQEQDLAGMRAAADAAMDESEHLRRELNALRALAFVNRSTVSAAEGLL
jgi:hypothetical protein